MQPTDPTEMRDSAGGETAARPSISAYSTSERRTVFTESGNGDGWIATDFTVDPET